ncbi:unnamed protein product [Somion occarium]|uniref:Uncharacterized protein n=1 Tax=Somion occarium TaxID=3059160 RepID=A0ABP1EAN4_9APHY
MVRFIRFEFDVRPQVPLRLKLSIDVDCRRRISISDLAIARNASWHMALFMYAQIRTDFNRDVQHTSGSGGENS